MTRHAVSRSLQRSTPRFAIELFERYGAECRHDGADDLFMDKRARKQIASDFGGAKSLRYVEPLLNGYAVVENGRVITSPIAPSVSSAEGKPSYRNEPENRSRGQSTSSAQIA